MDHEAVVGRGGEPLGQNLEVGQNQACGLHCLQFRAIARAGIKDQMENSWVLRGIVLN